MHTDTPSEKAVQKATGKPWGEWMSLLEQQNASKLSHKEIAVLLVEEYDVSAWWAQTITVEYERMIGRRAVGQSCEGDFQAGGSKTIAGSMDNVFAAWQKFMKGRDTINDVPLADVSNISKTDKWRYWRVGLQDGSKVNININQKAVDKVGVAVNHEKLQDTDAVATWKAFWKEFLKEFQGQL